MEHLHHFGLPQDPFSNELDLRFYFESGSHQDAQRRVERGLRQNKGLTLLTGEGGMGKTLLARRVLENLEEEVFEAILLVMLPGAADATGIFQRFARQLGCDEPSSDRAELLGQIYEHLAIVREDGRHAVLIVDDAQVMGAEVFSEITGLLNLEYEDRRLLSMLLIGSSELDQMIENDATVMPRIDVRVRLHPLDFANTSAYLHHRVAAVRGNPEIMSDQAVEALYKAGCGRPRLLNTLADNALFEAYLEGRPGIDPSDVERAAADLGVGDDSGIEYRTFPVPSAVGATPAPVVSAVVPEMQGGEPLQDLVEMDPSFAADPFEAAPAAEPEVELSDPEAGLAVAAAAALDLDEPVGEFELSPEAGPSFEAAPEPAADFSAFDEPAMDFGSPVEAALETDLSLEEAAGPSRIAPGPMIDLGQTLSDELEGFEGVAEEEDDRLLDSAEFGPESLDLDLEAPGAAPFAASPEAQVLELLETETSFGADALSFEELDSTPAAPEAPLEIAEADMAQVETGDFDELDDAFVELLEE